jgi:hypothetical protein
VVRESSEHTPPPSAPQRALRLRARDALLIALALAPAATLL